jgi:hypothetical protein
MTAYARRWATPSGKVRWQPRNGRPLDGRQPDLMWMSLRYHAEPKMYRSRARAERVGKRAVARYETLLANRYAQECES